MIDGLGSTHVTVEVDVRSGLPAFTIVGLADAAVREARERVRTAIRNSGYEFPPRRITANLAPGDIRKGGPGLDLALACAVLAASGRLSSERLETHALYGELGLDGALRSSRGALAVAHAAREAGMGSLVLACADARAASAVEGLDVVGVASLLSAARVLAGGAGDPLPEPHRALASRPQALLPELAEVRGQHQAVKALIVAAAGGHNLLLSGPPGSGKTMLAHRLPSILPPLSPAEAIEVARIRSLGADRRSDALARRRPFRAPHHSITAAGLIGGARPGALGEVVLAHRGVLFLDELAEFTRPTLEALRQPLEEGRVAIARASHSSEHPARFMLVAATNPCPCGYSGERERCACSEVELARHRRRLSGPLLDRIDLHVSLARDGPGPLAGAPLSTSATAREQVELARERQASRWGALGVVPGVARLNATLPTGTLQRHAPISASGQEVLRRAREGGLLSARGELRTLRLALTVADLRCATRVHADDVRVAIALRPHPPGTARRWG